MKIGINLRGQVPPQKFMKLIKEADEAGMDSILIPEYYLLRDAASQATMAALSTRNIRILLGVINVYTRSPALIAMLAASLDELSGGRVTLGIGVGATAWMAQLGYEVKDPLTRIVECTQIVKELLEGGNVSFEGKHFKVKNIKLGFEPLRRKLPIYLGVLGKKALRLAGRMYDGVILTAGVPINYLRGSINEVLKGVEEVGRKRQEVEIVANAFYCPSLEDRELSALKQNLAFFTTLPEFEVALRDFYGDERFNEIRRNTMSGNIKEAAKLIRVDEALELSVAGDKEQCHRKIKELKALGIDTLILVPTSLHLAEATVNEVDKLIETAQ